VQRHLESEITRLSDNIETLEAANRKFLNTAAALETDSEALSVYMRQLGYGRPDERFVRIVGLQSVINLDLSPGQVMRAADPDFMADKNIKITALVLGLLVIFFFITVDFLSLGILRRD